jgi:hypothetical protein
MNITPVIGALVVALAPHLAIAGPHQYFCTVNAQQQIEDDGTLAPAKLKGMLGRTFAADRSTGVIVVPEGSLWLAGLMKFTVLARGSAQNSFASLGTTEAGKDGVHHLFLIVHEYVKNSKKPFVLSTGRDVAVGQCE